MREIKTRMERLKMKIEQRLWPLIVMTKLKPILMKLKRMSIIHSVLSPLWEGGGGELNFCGGSKGGGNEIFKYKGGKFKKGGDQT